MDELCVLQDDVPSFSDIQVLQYETQKQVGHVPAAGNICRVFVVPELLLAWTSAQQVGICPMLFCDTIANIFGHASGDSECFNKPGLPLPCALERAFGCRIYRYICNIKAIAKALPDHLRCLWSFGSSVMLVRQLVS